MATNHLNGLHVINAEQDTPQRRDSFKRISCRRIPLLPCLTFWTWSAWFSLVHHVTGCKWLLYRRSRQWPLTRFTQSVYSFHWRYIEFLIAKIILHWVTINQDTHERNQFVPHKMSKVWITHVASLSLFLSSKMCPYTLNAGFWSWKVWHCTPEMKLKDSICNDKSVRGKGDGVLFL